MSESVSLTNAGLLIFAQEPASMQQFIQCRGRVRRIGSNVVVPVISLRSRGTVEDKLAGKMSLKLDFLREYLLQMKGDKCL
jgi:superfamily II DNA or RNA helicase